MRQSKSAISEPGLYEGSEMAVCSQQSKCKTDLSLETARRNEMRAAEGGQEIVKRLFVRQVDRRQPQRHPLVLGAKQVIRADAQVKQVARCDPRRVVIIVLGAVRRNPHPCCPAIGIRAISQPLCRRGKYIAAE